MSTIERFEDLECWQKARELCKVIYELTLKEKFSRDFSLVNQIRSSSGSAMDNISEEEFKHAYDLPTQTGKLDSGMIRYLNKSDLKGIKFKS